MPAFAFRALPVFSARDATLDFEQLTFALNNGGQIEINEKGELKLVSNTTVAMAYRNAAQNIAAGVFTRVKLDKTIKDPGSNLELTNGYYVVPAEGYYHVDGTVTFSTAGKIDVNVTITSIGINGTEKLRGVRRTTSTENEGASGTVSGIVFAKKADHIELLSFSTEEKALEVANEALNVLTVIRVA